MGCGAEEYCRRLAREPLLAPLAEKALEGRQFAIRTKPSKRGQRPDQPPADEVVLTLVPLDGPGRPPLLDEVERLLAQCAGDASLPPPPSSYASLVPAGNLPWPVSWSAAIR
jgi:hypothetical protein